MLVGRRRISHYHMAGYIIISFPMDWDIKSLLELVLGWVYIQQAHTAAPTVLKAPDLPTGTVVLIFAHIMGGTIMLPVAQSSFH
ncbi:hypothetical protein F5X96DRAFT_617618 [Biscogniauxia mediterranea]|nr:hypothetical protein F5X96DRAFT_617618 [Biscogniauxia mediterranea]